MKYYALKKTIELYADSEIEDVLINVLDGFYDEYDDIDEDDFVDHVREECCEQFIYYSDAWRFLEENGYTDFSDAIDLGITDVCGFASYYMEQLAVDFIYDNWDEYACDEEDED